MLKRKGCLKGKFGRGVQICEGGGPYPSADLDWGVQIRGGSKSAVTPANPVCRSAHCRDIHWSSDFVHGSNSTALHSMIKIVDLTYNTRDKIISFYLGK